MIYQGVKNEPLKFRAWDNEEKTYTYSKDIGLVNFFTICEKKPYLIIEPHTKFTDSEGDDVYDGDILDDEGRQPEDYRIIFWDKTHWKDCQMFIDYEKGVLSSKKVGNIHEKPELLKKFRRDFQIIKTKI